MTYNWLAMVSKKWSCYIVKIQSFPTHSSILLCAAGLTSIASTQTHSFPGKLVVVTQHVIFHPEHSDFCRKGSWAACLRPWNHRTSINRELLKYLCFRDGQTLLGRSGWMLIFGPPIEYTRKTKLRMKKLKSRKDFYPPHPNNKRNKREQFPEGYLARRQATSKN